MKGVLEIEQYLQTIKDADQINQGMAAIIREKLLKTEEADDKQDLLMSKTMFALRDKIVSPTKPSSSDKVEGKTQGTSIN